MKKLLAIAALLLASSAAQAQYTFDYGGKTIRIDPDRGTVQIPGIYDNTRKGKRSRDDDDYRDDARGRDDNRNRDDARGRDDNRNRDDARYRDRDDARNRDDGRDDYRDRPRRRPSQDARTRPANEPDQVAPVAPAPTEQAAVPPAPAPVPAAPAPAASAPIDSSTTTAAVAPADTTTPAAPPPAPAPQVQQEPPPAPRPSVAAVAPPPAPSDPDSPLGNIDNVAPQRLSYYLLNSVPVSLIFVALAVGAWALVDDKKDSRVAPRQLLLLLLLIYCGITTTQADFPLEAAEKWSWVWKALAFAIFLPLTLRTRLRFESLALFMVLSAAAIIIVGGIKTLASGGGYGALNLMVTNNTGLYESSTIAMVAIAIIPLIVFLSKHGTIFPPDWRVRIFAYALIFACLLMPVGTQARTGLICIGILGLMALRYTKRRILYASLVAVAAMVAVPLLPSSFTDRMNTIKGYKGDESASTRIAVWQWTWDYVKDHPMGGGFDAYRGNKLRVELTKTEGGGDEGAQSVDTTVTTDKARAYHSAYFEMLGEQGFPGLTLWLLIHVERKKIKS